MALLFTAFGVPEVANGFTTNDQSGGFQYALHDGSSVSVYSSADTGSGSVARLAHFNADGTREGTDLLLSNSPGNTIPFVSVRPVSESKVVASWINSTTGELFIRIYDYNTATGTLSPATSQIIVNQTSSADSGSGVAIITPLSNGGFNVQWTTSAATGDGSGLSAHARNFNVDGTPAGAEFQINSTTSGDQARPRAFALGNGNYVTVFQSADGGDGSGLGIRGRVSDAAGNPIGVDFLINTTGTGDQTRPIAATLSDGRVIVVWQSTDTGDGSGGNIRYRFLDSSGTPIGATDNIVNTTSTGNQTFAHVEEARDGHIVIAWESYEGAAGSVTFRARALNSDGTPDGADMTLFTSTVFPTANQASAFNFRELATGVWQLTWSSTQAGGGTNDGSGNGVQQRIFTLGQSTDVVLHGDANSQAFLGTSSSGNWLDGGAGSDTLNGGSGPNVMFGGLGDDTINAGTGSNTMIGGAGNDVMVIGTGANIASGIIAGGTNIGTGANGEANTLRLSFGGGGGTVDLRTATVSGITELQDVSSGGIVVVQAFAAQFDDLQTVTFSGATEQFTAFLTAANPSVDLSTISFIGFGGADQFTLDASAVSAGATIAGANVADRMIGGAGNDRFSGRSGNDTAQGGAGLDTSVYSDFSGAITWRYTASGDWTITTPTSGTDTLTRVEMIQTSDRPIRLYRLEGEDLAGDFNGDGRDDTLLRNANGIVETWESAASGAVATTRGHGALGFEYMIAGVGDFNGNNTDDILLRHESGTLAIWQMANGTISGSNVIALPLEWHVHAVADFNGDNTDDLLLRNANSDALVVWQMSNFGVGAGGGAVAVVTGTWRLLGTGDFDGDLKDDLLWYNSANNALSVWQMNGAAQIGGGVLGVLDATWSVQGIADFNGDGRDDILWRHTSGALAQWQMNGNLVSASAVFNSAPANWQIQNVATYDAGTIADILLRDTASGTTALWSMNGMAVAGSQVLRVPSNDWWVL